MLKYSERCTVDVVISTLVMWQAYGGFEKEFLLVSDQGSHFCNAVVKEFQKRFPFSHKLGICYSPWTNGSAETTHTLLIRMMRVLTSQYMLPREDWRYLTDLVVAFINNKPRLDAGGLTANQIYTGRLSKEFLGKHLINSEQIPFKEDLGVDSKSTMFMVFVKGKLREPANEKLVEEVMLSLQGKLQCVKKKIYDRMKWKRLKEREFINKKVKVEDIQYGPGDYVRVAECQPFQDKLLLV